jgi:2,3-bisphosphoglycerate-independent phosphoglycerate mutase
LKKILYVVLDGLADRPIKEFADKTPLEAAFTPNLDHLAGIGRNGLVYPLGEGIAPGSDTAVISLLGYEIDKYYTGRGPLEAFAEGLTLHQGEVAVSMNFATASEDFQTVKDRRCGRNLSPDEARNLADEINAKVALSSATFDFKSTVGHRGVLVLRGMHHKLSGWISNTDPAYERCGLFGVLKADFTGKIEKSYPLPGYEDSYEALEAASLLNEFIQKSHKVLMDSNINKKRIAEGKLAANILISRDAGERLPEFPSVSSLYNCKFGCFVEMPIERGIAILTGMEIIEFPSSCGHLDVDYPVWAKVAFSAIERYDGIYIHIKGPDEPAHDGNFRRKKEVIEAIDKFFFSPLLAAVKMDDLVLAVTADHTTASVLGAHSADPVPFLICSANIKPDGVLSFSESSARCGCLGQLHGIDLLPLLVKIAKE